MGPANQANLARYRLVRPGLLRALTNRDREKSHVHASVRSSQLTWLANAANAASATERVASRVDRGLASWWRVGANATRLIAVGERGEREANGNAQLCPQGLVLTYFQL